MNSRIGIPNISMKAVFLRLFVVLGLFAVNANAEKIKFLLQGDSQFILNTSSTYGNPAWFIDNLDKTTTDAVTKDAAAFLHMGDVIETGRDNNVSLSLNYAKQGFAKLENKMIYILNYGNNDAASASAWNSAFPYSAFSGKPEFAASYSTANYYSHAEKFSAGGVDWLVISIQQMPSQAIVTWAGNLINANSSRKVIIVNHTEGMGDGDIVWNMAKTKPNVVFLLSGHNTTFAHSLDTATDGHKIGSITVCWHNKNDDHYLGVVEIDTVTGTLDFCYYSPKNKLYKDLNNSNYKWHWSGFNFGGTAVPANDADRVSNTVPASMNAGQMVSVNVVMKNTGSDTWTSAAGHRLGITPTNNIWSISGGRVALPSNVAPNANVTFTYSMTAPATAGTYNFEMQMVDDVTPNQGWFGDKVTKQITVAAANLPPSFTTDPFSKPDATVGAAYDEPFNGQAVDPEGGTMTFSKVSGPVWLSVTSAGRAQGTPGTVDVGTNSFLVKVTDAGGLSDTATLRIKVNAATNPPQTVTFTSIGAEDGYLNESSETSNIGGGFNATGAAEAGLRIGDTSTKQQHKSVVSFDTSSIPDGAVIQSAVLKLVRGTVSGTVTNLGLIKVDIKGGTGFSGATALQNADFEAAADAAGVATMSYPSANGTLSSGSLNATGLTKVNKTGKTQLRIYFATDDNNNTTSDYLGFYPAENATVANRPVLVITYQ